MQLGGIDSKARMNSQIVVVLTRSLRSCKDKGNIQNHEVDPPMVNKSLQQVERTLLKDIRNSREISPKFKNEAQTIIPQAIERVREMYPQPSGGESNESPSKKPKLDQESAQTPEDAEEGKAWTAVNSSKKKSRQSLV
jgi:hypothetical protein